MRLAALALDYDGTIANGDRIDPLVRDAIAYARDTVSRFSWSLVASCPSCSEPRAICISLMASSQEWRRHSFPWK